MTSSQQVGAVMRLMKIFEEFVPDYFTSKPMRLINHVTDAYGFGLQLILSLTIWFKHFHLQNAAVPFCCITLFCFCSSVNLIDVNIQHLFSGLS